MRFRIENAISKILYIQRERKIIFEQTNFNKGGRGVSRTPRFRRSVWIPQMLAKPKPMKMLTYFRRNRLRKLRLN